MSEPKYVKVNIPPDIIYRENLDWFDLGKKCINIIENCKKTLILCKCLTTSK